MDTNEPATPIRRSYRLVALIVACALFMEQMDATVLTTALPTMAQDLAVSVTRLSSALTGYLLALALFIPASGRLADRFGARDLFRVAIVLFTLGSLLCAQAPNLPFLVVARFLQGVGGAMMIPVGRLILIRSVAKEDMVAATASLILPALAGAVLGPPIGGLIVMHLDWRWIFYLNLPIGLLGIVLTTLFITETHEPRPFQLDVVGFLIAGAAISCLLFGFEMASQPGRALASVAVIIAGLAIGAVYLRHARRCEDPVLDLSLLTYRSFRLSVIGGSLTRITQGAQPFLLPMMFQLGFGMPAATSGLLMIAGAIGALLTRWAAPVAFKRFGFRNSMIFNGLAGSLGYAVCGLFRPAWPMPLIVATLLVSGSFMSLQFTAYNLVAYEEIPPERMSAATSFYATLQQLMLSMGVCAGAFALQTAMTFTGRTVPSLIEFTVALTVVTTISGVAIVWNRRFAHNAGAAFH
ncbi:MFS transporter [Caulobacter sp.]|uniref:MFS transporter n=1 Tax=Caulobacter sp. TaxID=78 RepID=UPI001B0311A9|nr:MFS transporter [Caulobacter sp.]MBO9546361.1 MFS transporter [Caulobacter sp.]